MTDARQVKCCHRLYCAKCITKWRNKKGADKAVCPTCLTELDKSNIVKDSHADQKSAAQLRRCSFHLERDCTFVGTRQEVEAHEQDGMCDPGLAEKAAREAHIIELENEIDTLAEEKEVLETEKAALEAEKCTLQAQKVRWEKNSRFDATAWAAERADL